MYKEKTHISKATDLPQGFSEALERWRVEAERILNSDEIKWFARLASTTFMYNGRLYVVTPEDVYSEEELASCLENVLDAGFEILQGMITKDLCALGAESIENMGFLD
jgi:hypothetical protein